MQKKTQNWNNTATSNHAKRVEPNDLDKLICIIKSNKEYPTPVRAVGSVHSMNACFTTTGTQVCMDHFNYIGEPDLNKNTITVGAGVTMLQIRDALEKYDMETEVMPEIGNATAGSVACCGTKDSSLGKNGLGQISSTVVSVKLVDAKGTIREVRENKDDYDLTLSDVRCSYGLFGIIYEVTFSIRKRILLEYHYKWIPFVNNIKKEKEPNKWIPFFKEPTIEHPITPENIPTYETMLNIEASLDADGFLAFLQPFSNRIIVEQRKKLNTTRNERRGHLIRELRGKTWEHIATEIAEEKDMISKLLQSVGVIPHLNFISSFLPSRTTHINSSENAVYAFFDDLFLNGILSFETANGFKSYRADSMINFDEFVINDNINYRWLESRIKDTLPISAHLWDTFKHVLNLSNLKVKKPRLNYFDFTFWAIPVSYWQEAAADLINLMHDFYIKKKFRPLMPVEIYYIQKDDKSRLSFSKDGSILTFDLVHHSPNDPLWKELNHKINKLLGSGKYGARPLLNQTKFQDFSEKAIRKNRQIVHNTLGDDWKEMIKEIEKIDPDKRFLNQFFRDLM